VTADPLVLVAEVDRATERLLRTAATLDDTAVAGPSLLPGWTRGHVLTHLARNADSLVNLLTSARTGERVPQYPSRQAREDGIAAGAGRGAAEQVADLRAASARFAEAVAGMPPQAWTATVGDPDHPEPAARVPWRRLREVELHHVDLDAGYRPADWPAAFGQRLLHEVVTTVGGRPGAPALVLRPTDGPELTIGEPGAAPTVTGPVAAVVAWLTGRSGGEGLTVTPDGTLPTPPEWS
jgi:maleylpyruvate isomerase